MSSADIESARKDLLLWSPPIIADLMAGSYAASLGVRHPSARLFASMHTRMWRFVLQDNRSKLAEARKELTDMALLAGLDRPRLEAIDQAVLEELLDVIAARFTRSPEHVRTYSRVLLKTAADLTEMRLLAS